MDKEIWIAVKKYYARLPEMAEEAQRELLHKLEAEEPQVAAILTSLLRQGGDTDSALERPAMDKIREAEQPTDLIGRQIGKYKLTYLIGIGGMGRVYLADRLDLEAHQQVAVKIISTGFLTEVYKKRFDRERKILSRLNHPHITRIYDGGISEDGTPYIIMEYVEGKPLLEYVADNGLSLSERLDLFLDLCDAVDYAHKNFVMHRDLKPGNILVTHHGIVKVIDFGIAKILEDDAADEDLTIMGYIPLTPAYASPEQLKGEPLTVASDIYSLGVILYELVTGNKPFPGSTKSNLALTERLRHDNRAAKPSTRINPATTDDLKAWKKRIKGDIDNIVLKALKENPNERYGSADQLAEDLRRYSRNFPVMAAPDSVGYRIKKYARRNKSLVTLGAVIALVLTAGVAATLWQGRIAREERNRAQLEAAKAKQVTEFVTGLFGHTDPNHSKGAVITSENMLNKGSEQLQTLDDQPALQAEMYRVIGELYQKQNLYEAAEVHLRKSLSLFESVHGPDHHEVATSKLLISALHSFTNQSESSVAFAQSAGEFFAPRKDAYPIPYVKALNYEGRGKNQMGDYAGALEALEAAAAFAETRKNLTTDASVTKASVYNDLAVAYRELGRPERARAYLFKALDEIIAVQGETDQNVSSMYGNIGRSYYSAEQYDSSEYYSLKALEIAERIQPGKPSYSAQFAHADLTKVYIARERPHDALAHAQKCADMSAALYGEMHVNTSIGLSALADAYLALDAPDSAEKYMEAATLAMDTFYGGEHPMLAWNYWDKAGRYHSMGQLDKAIALKRKCLDMYGRTLPGEREDMAEANELLGTWLMEAGREAEAADPLKRSFEMWRATRGMDDPATQRVLEKLSEVVGATQADEWSARFADGTVAWD